MRQPNKLLYRFANGTFVFSVLSLAAVCALRTVPQLAGLETFAVTSGSMEPSIPRGSLIFVDPSRQTPVKGAVLTCRLGGDAQRTVTHRVYEVKEDGTFLLKGDANETPDLSVTGNEDVIGTVVGKLPVAGTLQAAEWFKLPMILAMGVSGAVSAWGVPEHTGKGDEPR